MLQSTLLNTFSNNGHFHHCIPVMIRFSLFRKLLNSSLTQSAEHSVQQRLCIELFSLLFSEFEGILILCNLAAQSRNVICKTFCLPILPAICKILVMKFCDVQYLLSMPAMIYCTPLHQSFLLCPCDHLSVRSLVNHR